MSRGPFDVLAGLVAWRPSATSRVAGRQGRRTAAAIVAAAVVTAVIAFVVDVARSGRPDVAPERLVAGSPDLVPGLRGKGLRVDYEVDGVTFAGTEVGSRQPGELTVDWYAESGLLFRQEVWKLGGPIEAWWQFRAQHPRPGFERDFGELVVGVDPATSVDADSYTYFCGNAGRSTRDALDDCQVWGYWARYGQYLIYLELSGGRYPRSMMDPIVAYFDARFAGLR